jgi:hypothetical protein
MKNPEKHIRWKTPTENGDGEPRQKPQTENPER